LSIEKYVTVSKGLGDLLAPMSVVLPEGADEITPENTSDLRYAARSKDGAGLVFLNIYQDHVETCDIPGVWLQLRTGEETICIPHTGSFTLPASTSAILPCGLSLDGRRLEYAATQLLIRIADVLTFASLLAQNVL
jgi:hypothetical protein